MGRVVSILTIIGLLGCSGGQRLRVTRGEFNQPSIKVLASQSARDADYQVFAQQGYEQAYDRLLQMDVLRRLSRGRLSELLGPRAVEKDALNISIGLDEATHRSFDKLAAFPDLMHALSAFADGVNLFISQIPFKRPDLARIYRELARNQDYTPALWTPIDSVAMAESMAFFLSTSLEEKLKYGIFGILSHGMDLEALPEKIAAQFDLRPIENTFIVNNAKVRIEAAAAQQSIPKQAVSLLTQLTSECLQIGYPWPNCGKTAPLGSNNWVVSKNYSGQEASFLANDPHLPLTFPTMFYEMALDSKSAGGTIQVAGVNVPGAPGIMIGHNGQMGWGFTNLGADVDDVYFEEISPDGSRVKFGDRWVPLEHRLVDLPVRLASGEVDNRPIVVRWVNHEYPGEQSYRSHRRPIFSDHYPKIKEALDTIEELTDIQYAISYRWVGHEGTTELQAVFAMNQATTPEQMREAISYFGVGTQNIVYADRAGNIGYMAHGKFPVRRYLSPEYPPYVPIVNHSDWDWDGYQPQVPQQENPERGFIVSANNDPWGDTAAPSSQRYLGYGFSTGIRAERITSLIEQRHGNIDMEWMKRIQFDHHDLLSQRFLDQIRPMTLQLSEGGREIADRLLAWDGESHRSRTEPFVWNRVLESLMRKHFDVKLSEESSKVFDLDDFLHSHAAVKTLYHRLGDALKGQSAYLSQPDAQAVWEHALNEAATDPGVAMNRTWGETNRMEFTNLLEGIFSSFAAYGVLRDGTFDTVDVAYKAYAPCFRLILRLAPEGISALNVMPGGNYSPTDSARLYKELLMWSDGKYRDLVSFY